MNANDIKPGDRLRWSTWCGTAEATVTITGPSRISTDTLGIYWEATCFASLDESLARTRGLEVVAAA